MSSPIIIISHPPTGSATSLSQSDADTLIGSIHPQGLTFEVSDTITLKGLIDHIEALTA
jgi:hypothetical protein